jgi:hypothetical protein
MSKHFALRLSNASGDEVIKDAINWSILSEKYPENEIY